MAAKSSGETPDTQNSDPPPIRPTLKTIAELTGFAVQTVSRALSDAPDISARTKEQVRKVADDIGYVPNRAGVRLRTGRTNVIALVLPTDNDVLNLTSRLISAIAEGVDGLQHGTRNILWLNRSDNRILNEQVIKRVHRQGQTKQVRSVELVAVDTYDSGVLSSQIQAALEMNQTLKEKNIASTNRG